MCCCDWRIRRVEWYRPQAKAISSYLYNFLGFHIGSLQSIPSSLDIVLRYGWFCLADCYCVAVAIVSALFIIFTVFKMRLLRWCVGGDCGCTNFLYLLVFHDAFGWTNSLRFSSSGLCSDALIFLHHWVRVIVVGTNCWSGWWNRLIKSTTFIYCIFQRRLIACGASLWTTQPG